MTFVLGIDPGCKGAWALISDQKLISVGDLTQDENGLINLTDISREIKALVQDSYCSVIVEQLHAIPGVGTARTMFKLGMSYAQALLLAKRICSEFELVTPKKWKNAQNLNTDKAKSIQLALEKYPESAKYLTRKKDHDRAEAILIADYLINKNLLRDETKLNTN